MRSRVERAGTLSPGLALSALLIVASVGGCRGDVASSTATTGVAPQATEAPSGPIQPSTPMPNPIMEVELPDATSWSEASGLVVLEAAWGNAGGEIGRSVEGFGPCCFDVAADGTVVILDTQNQRVVAFPPASSPQILFSWAAEDGIFPNALAALSPDKFVLLGLTESGGLRRRNDVIVVPFEAGEARRGKTNLFGNADLRVTPTGAWASSNIWSSWHRIVSQDGALIPLEDQVTSPRLPTEYGDLEIVMDQENMLVTRYGESRSVLDLSATGFGPAGFWSRPDGVVAIGWTSGGDRVMVEIRDDGSLLGWRLPWVRAADAETWGSTRVVGDSAYDLQSNETGMSIVRFPLGEDG
jgi:hypothetical protein